MDKIYVTREGLARIRADLDTCKEKRIRLAAIIEHARGFGDLRENAEYHAAKEEQAVVQAQIRDLEDKLARAAILDDARIDNTKAYLGARVRVRNNKTNRETTYLLVSPVEADLAKGKISVKSPVGQALLGRSVGETVVAKVPAGDVELEILEIAR